ncbi:hypothetical protein RQ734_21525, partial [Roseomonas mucosa]|uniref:hypothetical protein n=1 Tax=Roseomonas mucosa TaxID=207340 RepID=UPI0028CDDA30
MQDNWHAALNAEVSGHLHPGPSLSRAIGRLVTPHGLDHHDRIPAGWDLFCPQDPVGDARLAGFIPIRTDVMQWLLNLDPQVGL